MRFGCLINTRSGGHKGKQLLQELKSLSGGYLLDIFEASQQGVTDMLASVQDYDRILIAGGDGTVSQFVNAAKVVEVPICLYPLGTGNDLARELNLASELKSLSATRVLKYFEQAPLIDLTVWRLSWDESNSVLFTNYASFGFDGYVIESFHKLRESFPWIPRYFGRIGNRLCYLLAGLQSILSRSIAISSILKDGEPVEAQYVVRTLFFSNISSVMGLAQWKPPGDPGDALLELREVSRVLDYAQLLAGCGSGCKDILQASKWSFELEHSAPFQVDGEDFSHIVAKQFTIESAGTIKFSCAE